MKIVCCVCEIEFNRKPSEIGERNFCGRKCNSIHKISFYSESKFLNKFVKSKWININLRAGKYRRDTSKNKCYKDIFIEFTRDEFKKWCVDRLDDIKKCKSPSIDRKDSNKNYTLDNIQIMELADNIRKKKFGCRYINGPLSNTERGVRENKHGKWIARISILNNETHLGTFKTREDALNAFRNAYKNHYGVYPF